ncbi:sigma-70 family RNA polymerase sigma factor [Altererythrobacter sp. CC-YST694]|uniref:sigma-70 family RNA polymerase sigma factor n=1 Tax=Altererythrobacter sp. CC-YST694 TaxID=2755038 RepID=UPI001D01DE54|nr:sigma-70 family RNA polymerase sigma factor [Altererythrobacter sp. CC-YST694]MCB5423823.1 sigma-70 family RNA polymerase sigma factor [Altererythrobacter sp. CC-YST694]
MRAGGYREDKRGGRTPLRGVELLLRPERVEAALWRSFGDDPGPENRHRLFEHYRPFAARLAASQFARRARGNYERGDVEQLAYEALIQAIGRFDAARGVPFEAFARLRIRGHIANHLAQVSEGAAQRHFRHRIERERLKSLQDRGGEPLDALAALSALSAAIALGLMLEGERKPELHAIPDPAPTPYESLAWRDLQGRVRALVDSLPEREEFVIRQHYRNGVSFQQIAVLMGVTKGRVSQIHKAALDRLRGMTAKLR